MFTEEQLIEVQDILGIAFFEGDGKDIIKLGSVNQLCMLDNGDYQLEYLRLDDGELTDYSYVSSDWDKVINWLEMVVSGAVF